MSRKYKNSPIVEALCEFRFEPDSIWDLTVPGLIYERVQDVFPKRFQLQTSQVNLGTEIFGQTPPLMRFQSSDDQTLIQVGPNLLTVHHLRPYTSWKEFFPLIERCLNAYREAANPKSIHKIALRYINRIEIQSEPVTLEKYFDFRPFVGIKLPQNISAFSVSIQVPHRDGKDSLNVQLANIPSTAPNIATLILDLNYFLARPDDVLWNNASDWLGIAHHSIEENFEACITDQLRQTFGEVVE